MSKTEREKFLEKVREFVKNGKAREVIYDPVSFDINYKQRLYNVKFIFPPISGGRPLDERPGQNEDNCKNEILKFDRHVAVISEGLVGVGPISYPTMGKVPIPYLTQSMILGSGDFIGEFEVMSKSPDRYLSEEINFIDDTVGAWTTSTALSWRFSFNAVRDLDPYFCLGESWYTDEVTPSIGAERVVLYVFDEKNWMELLSTSTICEKWVNRRIREKPHLMWNPPRPATKKSVVSPGIFFAKLFAHHYDNGIYFTNHVKDENGEVVKKHWTLISLKLILPPHIDESSVPKATKEELMKTKINGETIPSVFDNAMEYTKYNKMREKKRENERDDKKLVEKEKMLYANKIIEELCSQFHIKLSQHTLDSDKLRTQKVHIRKGKSIKDGTTLVSVNGTIQEDLDLDPDWMEMVQYPEISVRQGSMNTVIRLACSDIGEFKKKLKSLKYD